MLLPVSNLKRIHVLYTGLPGLPGINTIYGHEDGVSAADQVAAVLDFFDGIGTSLNDSMTVAVNDVVEIVDSTNGNITGTDDTGAGGTVTGSNSSEAVPFSTQLCCGLRTGTYFSGRELRGRFFVPGWCESENDQGVPSASLISFVQGKLDTLIGDANLAVFSPTHFQWASVHTGTVMTQWAVLRSRRP
jgi:hypothetical protein